MEDLQWKTNYNCFQWAWNQISDHEDGAFPSIRQELTGDANDDARYIARRNKDIVRSSKFKLLSQKNTADAVIAGARLPRIPANVLDGNNTIDAAMGASLNNPAHVVLAITRDVLQPVGQIQAVTDLKSIRQGTTPAEEFLQYEFEPMVYVAQLPDAGFGDTLIEATNPHINKKMKHDH